MDRIGRRQPHLVGDDSRLPCSRCDHCTISPTHGITGRQIWWCTGLSESETSHNPRLCLANYTVFSRPHSRETHVVTSWAFSGRFNRVANTLGFVLMDLPLAASARLSWVATRNVALSWWVLLFVWVLTLLLLYVATAVCLLECFWHSCCCFFGRLLLIDSCCEADFPPHALCLYSLPQ